MYFVADKLASSAVVSQRAVGCAVCLCKQAEVFIVVWWLPDLSYQLLNKHMTGTWHVLQLAMNHIYAPYNACMYHPTASCVYGDTR